MSNYVKFIKNNLSNKKRLGEFDKRIQCILARQTAFQNEGPREFYHIMLHWRLLLQIGFMRFGIKYNLTPMFVFKRLDIEILIAHPEGKIEDVSEIKMSPSFSKGISWQLGKCWQMSKKGNSSCEYMKIR
ncbi:hypothetical protein EPI10_015843 [Gossypium australe]|uniref:Uncharacterized protein n=1 Tax=Gossypium australe TaxID=47621 RepID=A0A5B6VM16_9ROSI|nr:hypothetical protein EPI10_015843 [Gossypium australe]